MKKRAYVPRHIIARQEFGPGWESYRYNKVGISVAEFLSLRERRCRSRLRLPLPQSDSEFQIVSEYIFGVPLHVCFHYSGMTFLEKHDSYYDQRFESLALGSSYDVDSYFRGTIFPPLTCGGIGGSVYSNGWDMSRKTRCVKRIKIWMSKQGKELLPRPAFVRLAARIRERREQQAVANASVLVGGRVDAAQRASFVQERN